MRPYTKKEVEELKAKYPHIIKEIEIYPAGTNFNSDGTADEEPAYFIVKRPSKSLLNLLNHPDYKGDVEKSNAVIISNCILLGDKERLDNDASIFTGVMEILASLISSSRFELKKV